MIIRRKKIAEIMNDNEYDTTKPSQHNSITNAIILLRETKIWIAQVENQFHIYAIIYNATK